MKWIVNRKITVKNRCDFVGIFTCDCKCLCACVGYSCLLLCVYVSGVLLCVCAGVYELELDIYI